MRACLALSLALLALPLGCQRLPEDEEPDDGGPSTPDTTGGTFLPGDEDATQDGADDAQETEGSSFCNPVDQTGCASGQKCTAIVTAGVVSYTCAAAPGGPSSSRRGHSQ